MIESLAPCNNNTNTRLATLLHRKQHGKQYDTLDHLDNFLGK